MLRRDMLLATAALPAAAVSFQHGGSGRPKNIAISSANGLAACKRANEILQAGGDTLEAVVSGVTIVEDDPEDSSVGFGGLPNEDGVVELDASVMHGPTRRCGAVAAVHGIKNVARLAKLVMEQTAHSPARGRRRDALCPRLGRPGNRPVDREGAARLDGLEAIAARRLLA